MARHLRIEYPGAFYHVYSRGNQKQPIFLTDDDRFYFLKTLGEAHERLAAVIHVYCLMPNHYHLALVTPLGNLSRIMHFINTAFSVYLNLKHDRCGHLFQGRFGAILVDAESYARTVTMYIHGNPVRKKFVSRPEEFEWSSAAAYYGLARPPSWLRTETILRSFGNSVEKLKAEHELYLFGEKGGSPDPDFARAARLGILGDDAFIDEIRRSHLESFRSREDAERPEIDRLKEKPALASIHSCVLEKLGASRRMAKKVTILIAHKNTGYKLKEIGAFFDIGPVAVAVAFRKIKGEVAAIEPLRLAVEELEASLFPGKREAGGKL